MNNSNIGPGTTPSSRRAFMRTMMLGASGAVMLPSLGARGAMTLQPVANMQPIPMMTAQTELDLLKAQNPAVHAFATDVLSQIKYSFTATAAGGRGAGNEFAETAQTFIATRKPAARARMTSRANQLLAAPPAVRQAHFGRFAAVDPATVLTMGHAQLMRHVTAMPSQMTAINRLSFQNIDLPSIDSAPDDAPSAADAANAQKQAELQADIAAGELYKHLELVIHSVTCKEETADSGATDEIALGGNVIGATGHTEKVKQWLVSENFGSDAGEMHVFKYNEPWHFGFFNVDNTKPFPHFYSAQIAMAELDGGGFGDFLIALWNKIKTVVVSALADLAATGIGSLIGSVFPGLGTVIGAVIGAIASWLVGLFHNDDDVVGCCHSHLKLGSARKSKHAAFGLLTHAGHTHTLDYREGGHYQVQIGWRLFDDAGYADRKHNLAMESVLYNGAEAAAD